MTLKERLDKMGLEYKTLTEMERERRFVPVIMMVCDAYGCLQDINDIEEKGFPMMNFLEMIYNGGFYAGLNHGLNAESDFEVADSDLFTRYQDEIQREFAERSKQDDINYATLMQNLRDVTANEK